LLQQADEIWIKISTRQRPPLSTFFQCYADEQMASAALSVAPLCHPDLRMMTSTGTNVLLGKSWMLVLVLVMVMPYARMRYFSSVLLVIPPATPVKALVQ